MKNRTPSQDDLTLLSREEWEDLCSLICVSLYDAHRVEDHFGKGNGLDSYRDIKTHVEGWQFRRFNDRLGDKQVEKIKKNIVLAKTRCVEELCKNLTDYTVIFNINPEPGHGKSKGEIQRLAELTSWAINEHNIDFKYKGLTWVHSILMKNPMLKPELFEDLNASIQDVGKKFQDEIFNIKEQINKLVEQNPLEGKLRKTFDLLLREANVHYQRGKELESNEEFQRSITSLNDALRLIEGNDIDRLLEGKILLFLSGVEVLSGYLNNSIYHAKSAISLFEKSNKEESIEYIFALGNLSFGQYMNQEYNQAYNGFSKVLSYFENSGNLLEIVRTLTHMLSLKVQSGDLEEAVNMVDRVQQTSIALDKLLGPTDVSLSSFATVANVYAEIGVKNQDKEFLYRAINIYELVEKNTENAKFKRVRITSKGARARCLWNADQLEESRKIHLEVIEETKGFLPKLYVDTKFNLALLLSELGDIATCKQLLREAVSDYKEIGDLPSAQDAMKMLEEFQS